ncbi:MAG: hypothetical protein FWB96_02200 [Defluviitaleaceae bacterium]|nr:hypothetical protein [Defluviitaleaceae bacterium]MCL2262349.1 hypothetical protein [Defluviitaleaceae bacterium]
MFEKFLENMAVIKNATSGKTDNDSGEKNNVLKYGRVTLENNSICYDAMGQEEHSNRTTLQISNISRTWVGRTARIDGTPNFPVWTIAGIVVSLILIIALDGVTVAILGLVLLLFCGYMIYSYFKSIKPDIDVFGLHITMNSGFVAVFSSLDVNGLFKFQGEITDRFLGRTPQSETLVINIDDNKGNISFGDRSENTLNREISSYDV